MEWFALLMGHLLGDYILQDDWMAKNKTNPWPAVDSEHPDYESQAQNWWLGNYTCFIHCALYTGAITAFSFWWIPWWGILACFLVHFPIDRWRLARWWMIHCSGQEEFATNRFSPWSIVLVDNIFHLLALFAIGALCLPRLTSIPPP